MILKTIVSIFATLILLFKLLAALKSFIDKVNAINKLPSPPGAHWLWGHVKLGPFDTGFQWLRDTVKAYPRAYAIRLGPTPAPVLVHPDTIKPVLADSVPSFKTDYLKELSRDWVDEGLLVSNGPKWKRNRRLLTHSFHLDVLRAYIPVYNECVEVLLGKMDKLAAEGKPMSINHELVLCTFDVILRTACSYKSNAQMKGPSPKGTLDMFTATGFLAWTAQERLFNKPLLLLRWIFRLSSLYSQQRDAYVYVRKFTQKLVDQREKELADKMESGDPITKPRDFLDTLLMARDADGTGLSCKEIIDEINTFLFAGHETTSTSMTWLMYYLAKYPEHQSKIREEVGEILAGRDSDSIDMKDCRQMEYMTLVIKESLRMNSAVPHIGRLLKAPLTVEGVVIPSGSVVLLNIYQLHHNPTVWGDDHMEFRPSRFLPENMSKMDPFAFLPFSAGSRNCIGQQFAMNEMKVFIARILRRFRVCLVEGEPEPVPKMTLVLKPHNDLLLTFEPIR